MTDKKITNFILNSIIQPRLGYLEFIYFSRVLISKKVWIILDYQKLKFIENQIKVWNS